MFIFENGPYNIFMIETCWEETLEVTLANLPDVQSKLGVWCSYFRSLEEKNVISKKSLAAGNETMACSSAISTSTTLEL